LGGIKPIELTIRLSVKSNFSETARKGQPSKDKKPDRGNLPTIDGANEIRTVSVSDPSCVRGFMEL